MASDFDKFVQIADILKEESRTYALAKAKLEAKAEKWAKSPFKWIAALPPSAKGAIAKELVSAYLKEKGFHIEPSPDKGIDYLVNGVRVGIRSSTQRQDGKYWFQQIRQQDYELLLLLGLSHNAAHCWVLPKDVVTEQWGKRESKLSYQHGGAPGRDTTWLKLTPGARLEWLRNDSGSLSDAIRCLKDLARPIDTLGLQRRPLKP